MRRTSMCLLVPGSLCQLPRTLSWSGVTHEGREEKILLRGGVLEDK